MSQISYNVVSVVQKNAVHIRGIAKILQTNQTTVARKVHELEDMNVLDSRQEGKNKVCFIKDSLEAKDYLKIVEHDKLIELLRNRPLFRKIVQAINENERIKLAIIFGSYAKNTAGKDSDIDIYVETSDMNIKKKLELIDTRISVKIGEFNTKNLLIKEIMKDHVIIKGIDRYYYLVH